MENKCCIPTIIDLVKRYINRDLPLVKTSEVGHNIDSKAMIIGKMINRFWRIAVRKIKKDYFCWMTVPEHIRN